AEKQDWKLFKWGYEKGFPCTIFSHFLVVQYGQMELLDLLAQDRSNWSDVIFTIAGARGDLQMLQWAVLNQPKFEQLTLEQWAQKECSLWNQTVFAAVRGGHLEMLQQACALGCPLPPEAACTIASKKRDWRTLRWLLDQGVTKTEELRAVLSAYALPDLMTLNAIGIPVDVLISKETFKEGNFSKIQWALSIGFKLTFELYRLGVSSDNPQLIDLLRKQALRQIFLTSFGYKGFS
ncbi:MAG: hypothetical protein LLG04_03790, partial [Parachlamydia sp.]|nr:hypothetical protein [Parachlamydia sp.]